MFSRFTQKIYKSKNIINIVIENFGEIYEKS